jgi:hypothetical protein
MSRLLKLQRHLIQQEASMSDITIDPAAMGRLAKALNFICGATNPTTIAVQKAADTGAEGDIKKARAMFLKLKQSDRAAALNMMRD